MASVRKKGKRWIAEVRSKGAYRSKTFETKLDAQRWAVEIETLIGKRKGALSYHTLGEAFARYAKEISPSRKGHRWEVIRLEKLGRDKIASIPLSDLVYDDIQAWIGRQSIKPASINRELNLISAVLKAARIRWKWMTESIMQDVIKPKNPPPRDRLITDKERERILLALEYEEGQPATTQRQQIAVAFLLAIETAMRQGEIWGLDWERINLETQVAILPDTKNGTRRKVALSRRAVELLKMLGVKESGKLFNVSQQTAGVIYRRAVMLAGVENLTFHDTRHTGITNLARKLDVLSLARMVGHKDIRSLQIYFNESAEDIAKRL